MGNRKYINQFMKLDSIELLWANQALETVKQVRNAQHVFPARTECFEQFKTGRGRRVWKVWNVCPSSDGLRAIIVCKSEGETREFETYQLVHACLS